MGRHAAEEVDSAGDQIFSTPSKAFEIELVQRVIVPLKGLVADLDIAVDVQDKDWGRIAKYCSGKVPFAPELGSVGHFLQSAVNSKDRAEQSPLCNALRMFLSKMPNGGWLVNANKGLIAISTLTSKFRNRAAHTDELARLDYEACFTFVAGSEGILWSLIEATLDVKSRDKQLRTLA